MLNLDPQCLSFGVRPGLYRGCEPEKASDITEILRNENKYDNYRHSDLGSNIKLGGQFVMWGAQYAPSDEIGLTDFPKPGFAGWIIT